MARDRDPALDLSGLEDAFEWISARRNVLVGVALVIVLAIAATSFVRRQSHESAVKPWRAVFTANESPWNATPANLAETVEQGARGTDAEPYAAYWRALRQYEEGERAAALSQLKDFKARYATSLLSKDAGPSTSGKPPVDEEISGIQRLLDWSDKHPLPTANPAPDLKTSVTFVTEKGSIVIALYPDIAPASCAAFLQLAPSLKDQFIAKAAPDRWIELGQSDAGAAIETTAFTEDFPPYENTSLLHVRGSAAFRQTPFSRGPFYIDVHVQLENDFELDGQSSVFGQVTEGLEVLATISKEERRADQPQVLAKPVRITDVIVKRADGG